MFRRPVTLIVQPQFTHDGVVISAQLHGPQRGQIQPIPIPFRLPQGAIDSQLRAKPEYLNTLIHLDDLVSEGKVSLQADSQGGRGYLIPPRLLYDLGEEHQVAGLPAAPTPVQFRIRTTSAPGIRNFKMHPILWLEPYGDLALVGNRYANIIRIGSDVLLLEEPVYKVLRLLDTQPRPRDEHHRFAAQIKQLVLEAGGQPDPDDLLARRDYVYVDKAGLDFNLEAPDKMRITAHLPGLDPEVEQALMRNLDAGGDRVYFRKGRHVTRTFAGTEVRKNWDEIKSERLVEGPDVPRMLLYPESYLPDDVEKAFDLSQFSERVKGFREFIYRSSPYISVTPSGDKFQVRTGMRLEDVFAGPDSDPRDRSSGGGIRVHDDSLWSNPEFIQQADKAARRGQDFFLWNGQWFQVPQDLETFEEMQKKADGLLPGGQGTVDAHRLNMILDIYRNVEGLEYNEYAAERLAAWQRIQTPTLPAGFRTELHDYQTQGFAWLKSLHINRVGGLLADEMGLGKTVQIIALMASLHETGDLTPSVVIQPAAILENWAAEIKKFYPGIHVLIHRGPQRIRNVEWLRERDVVLVTYDTLVRDQAYFGQVDWNLVVCDEAQAIKNYTTHRSDSAKALKASCRVALTGTPVENELGELWSIVDFAHPGALGSYSDFQTKFERPIINHMQQQPPAEEEAQEIIRQLRQRIKPFFLRRTKADHLQGLPDVVTHDFQVDLSPVQRQLYMATTEEYNRRVEAKAASRGEALNVLQRLIRICSHPHLVIQAGQRGSGELVEVPKMKKTMAIIGDVAQKGEKALIYTHYKDMQGLLRLALQEEFQLTDVPIINGDVSGRKHIVDEFNRSPGFRVMILSPKAGGVGLNITGANHVIHYTRWWNPAVERQATDRVHRIGQKKTVHVYYPIVTASGGAGRNHTVEEAIADIHKDKSRLADAALFPTKRLDFQEDLARKAGLKWFD